MRLLLDTHAVLWWQTNDDRLSDEARRHIAVADIVWVSAVSGCEVAIKTALGRLRIDESFPLLLEIDDFTELPLNLQHIEQLKTLPSHHKDPFDLMLAAQVLAENAHLVTRDRAFEPYGLSVIWT